MLVNVLIQLFLAVFSYLIPKKKDLILFGAGSKKDFRGNPKFLYLYLNKYKTQYQAVWSSGDKSVFNMLKSEDLPVIYRHSVKGLWNILRAKYLVIEKSSKDVYYTDFIFGNFNFIQTWHGITIKKLGIHALEEKKGLPGQSFLSKQKVRNFMKKYRLMSMMKYKLILSTTENQDNLLKDIFLNPNVVTLGYPRNDLFFNRKLLFSDLYNLFNLKNYKKIFLYAPTFRDTNDSVKPFSDIFLRNLDTYFTENEYLLIIKKHPLQKNLLLPEGLKNIFDYSSQIIDLHEILYFTDVLISDYSSASNDFILTEKPVIYYNYDLQEYEKTCRGFYYDYYEIFAGPFANNENELFEKIKNIEQISSSEDYKTKYEKQLNFFHKFRDGNSCKRLIDYIENNL